MQSEMQEAQLEVSRRSRSASRRFTIGLLVLFSLLVPVAASLHAADLEGDITVEAEGYGTNRSDALLKAKREAVSSGIGTMLISETEIKNFMLQKDVILTRTVGAVKSYKILKEEPQGADTFLVKISAVVSRASIKQDLIALKVLLESMDKPRMMVLIREEGGNSAETAILDYLGEKKFELVDAAAVAALMDKDDVLIQKATEGDPAAAAKLGAANGAEYVIVGKVIKSTMKNDLLGDAGMVSGQANITAKVVNASNARIIASKAALGAAAHISPDSAMEKATEKAATKLMDHKLFEEIVSSFQDTVNNGMTLEVTVNNVSDFSTQKEVRQIISTLDVSSINKRGFGGGKLQLSVVFRGSADSFAEAVDGSKLAGGKKLAVTDIKGSRVVISLK
ncbi:MAG: hypothetical protein KKG35_13570 [Proteobacteria bacterium]|nr:hypothetical protein [Pseudomonadota bacterium]